MRVDKPNLLSHTGFVSPREKFSLAKLSQEVAEEADAYRWLEAMCWPTGPICPHCGHDRAYFIQSKHPDGRATGNLKTRTQRRVWKCANCRKQFSVLTGTIMQGTKIPVRTWILVMVEICSDENGISAREVERKYGLTAESAWFMLHRLREAMRREPLSSMMRGTIVADETWIGGNPRNRHGYGKESPVRVRTPPRPNLRTDKTLVLSLVNKQTGEVRSVVAPNVTGANLRKVIAEQVDMAERPTDRPGLVVPTGRPGVSLPSDRQTTRPGSMSAVRSPPTTLRATSPSSSGPWTGLTTTSASRTCSATWGSSTSATAPASCRIGSGWPGSWAGWGTGASATSH